MRTVTGWHLVVDEQVFACLGGEIDHTLRDLHVWRPDSSVSLTPMASIYGANEDFCLIEARNGERRFVLVLVRKLSYDPDKLFLAGEI